MEAGNVSTFRDLRVYIQGQDTAAMIFIISKGWPRDERYSLTDQIRRSSRAVGANIAEAWAKRRYPAHFVSKLTDADAEATETRAWLDSALRSGYIHGEQHRELDERLAAVSGGLVKMMAHPEKWCGPANLVREEGVSYVIG
jgi:four helix bundle protein